MDRRKTIRAKTIVASVSVSLALLASAIISVPVSAQGIGTLLQVIEQLEETLKEMIQKESIIRSSEIPKINKTLASNQSDTNRVANNSLLNTLEE